MRIDNPADGKNIETVLKELLNKLEQQGYRLTDRDVDEINCISIWINRLGHRISIENISDGWEVHCGEYIPGVQKDGEL